MKKYLNNKLLMFWAVLEVLTKFKSLWESIPGFVTIFNEFDTATRGIKKTSAAAGVKTGKITEEKNTQVSKFVLVIYRLTSVLSVHATNTGNAELKNSVDYTDAELADLRPADLLALSEEIQKLVAANKPALVLLGLKEADVTALDNYIGTFEKITTSPRTTIIARKTAGTLLNPQFKKASSILKEKVDGLVEQFHESDTDFYTEYWNARNKIDYGTRHEKDEENAATETKDK
jgi:hypothetical protein